MTTVTCVILSHNHRAFAVQAVQSALTQDYPAELLDVVILDDGSTDGTGDLLEHTFGDDPRVTVLRQENQGFVRSTNRVVAAATGELIGFLDGDDMWVRDRVRRQVALLDARPDVGLVHGDMEIVDAQGATMHPSFFGYSGFGEVPRGRILGTLLRMNVVTTSSIMVRASLRDRFLPVPDELFFPDWHVATMVAEVAAIEHVDGVTARYRSHSSNMGLGGTGNKFYADMRHNVRITRWHLRHLDVSAVLPGELVLAAQSMLTQATRAAAELGCWAADVLPVTDGDRDEAVQATRAARAADRAGDQAAALLARVRALAADPWDGAAHADLMISATRMDPTSIPARPPETRTVGVLAFADELLAEPALLEAYAAAVSGRRRRHARDPHARRRRGRCHARRSARSPRARGWTPRTLPTCCWCRRATRPGCSPRRSASSTAGAARPPPTAASRGSTSTVSTCSPTPRSGVLVESRTRTVLKQDERAADAARVHSHHPRVTVAIATRDGAATLREAIDSCLEQSYSDLEVLVVDDGSTDGSAALLAELADERLRVVRHDTVLGPAACSETILREARGELIARLEDDDVALPDRVKLQVQVFDRHPETGVVHGDAVTVDAEGRAIGAFRSGNRSRRALIDQLVRGTDTIVAASVMVHRRVFDEVGGYDAALAHFSDLDLWLRAARSFRFRHVPDGPLVLSRRYGRDEEPTPEQLIELQAVLRSNLADWPLDDLVPELDWSVLPRPYAERRACLVLAHAFDARRLPRLADEWRARADAATSEPWRAARRPSGRRIVLSSFGFDDAGGGTIVPRYVAKELAQRGHQVTVFAAGVARLDGRAALRGAHDRGGRRRGRLGAQPSARAARSRASPSRAGRSGDPHGLRRAARSRRPRRRAPAQPAQPRAVAGRRDVLARHPHGLLDPQLLARLRAQLPLPRRPLAVRRPG